METRALIAKNQLIIAQARQATINAAAFATTIPSPMVAAENAQPVIIAFRNQLTNQVTYPYPSSFVFNYMKVSIALAYSISLNGINFDSLVKDRRMLLAVPTRGALKVNLNLALCILKVLLI